MIGTVRQRHEGGYQPLVCMGCKTTDLLETEHGVVVFLVHEERAYPRHYVGAYWACKGACDEAMQKRLGVSRKPTPWVDLRELLNPFGFGRWLRVTSRQISCGRLNTEIAAKAMLLSGILAQAALREPTDEDEEEFKQFRMLDGL